MNSLKGGSDSVDKWKTDFLRDFSLLHFVDHYDFNNDDCEDNDNKSDDHKSKSSKST